MRLVKLLLFFIIMTISQASDDGFKGAIDLSYNKDIYGKNQIEAIKNWGVDTHSAGVSLGNTLNFEGGSIDPLTSGQKISGIRGMISSQSRNPWEGRLALPAGRKNLILKEPIP